MAGPRLSVNVNKVATLRNSRGGDVPSVVDAVRVCLDAGATGITVHPRADERHIRRADVRDIAAMLAPLRAGVEFNIEGDPRPDLLELVTRSARTSARSMPVRPGEITSRASTRLIRRLAICDRRSPISRRAACA
jgi:pyridoxine 5-phosphate synthase